MALLKKLFYFSVAVFGVLSIIITIANLAFEFYFQNKIYPGVKVGGVDFGIQTESAVEKYYSSKLSLPKTVVFTYETKTKIATYSATPSDFNLRYDVRLMANRAFSVGRQNKNLHYDFLQKMAAVTGNINLPVEIAFDEDKVHAFENKIALDLEEPAIDAQFKFEPNSGPDSKGRVVTFKQSKSGLKLDRDKLEQELKSIVTKPQPLSTNPITKNQSLITFSLPMVSVFPSVTTSRVNRLGINDLLATGVSYFYDSIPGRIENIRVGSEKISGSLISPGEEFSFNQSIGTVSAVFGFAKAYVIKDNKTVLEDGGGVCQVSTTLYRAVLNAGLPVTKREPHSYRVPFYEEGGFKPGMDATVYPPDPDFKFKNDTQNWLLIQANYDPQNFKLSFDIFGTSDGRKTEIQGPFILSTSPPPPPIYEDRPDLLSGTLQQTDTAHWGANTTFTRIVTREGKELINETINTSYIPWPARYIRGTKM